MKTTCSGSYPTRPNRAAPALLLMLVLCLFCSLAPSPSHAAPTGTYVTGNLSLGTYAADIVKLSSGVPGFTRPDSAVAVLDVTIHNLLGPVTLETSYRQPLYGSNFWNKHTEQFCAELTAPLGKLTLFGHYERNPASGFEWGWCGVRVPFRL